MSHTRNSFTRFLKDYFLKNPGKQLELQTNMQSQIAERKISSLFDAIDCWMSPGQLNLFVIKLKVIIETTHNENALPSDELRNWVDNLVDYGRKDIIDSSGKKLKPALVTLLNWQPWINSKDWDGDNQRDLMLSLLFLGYVSRLTQFILSELTDLSSNETYFPAFIAINNALNIEFKNSCKDKLFLLRLKDNAKMVVTGVGVGIAVIGAVAATLFATKKMPRVETEMVTLFTPTPR